MCRLVASVITRYYHGHKHVIAVAQCSELSGGHKAFRVTSGSMQMEPETMHGREHCSKIAECQRHKRTTLDAKDPAVTHVSRLETACRGIHALALCQASCLRVNCLGLRDDTAFRVTPKPRIMRGIRSYSTSPPALWWPCRRKWMRRPCM